MVEQLPTQAGTLSFGRAVETVVAQRGLWSGYDPVTHVWIHGPGTVHLLVEGYIGRELELIKLIGMEVV